MTSGGNSGPSAGVYVGKPEFQVETHLEFVCDFAGAVGWIIL